MPDLPGDPPYDMARQAQLMTSILGNIGGPGGPPNFNSLFSGAKGNVQVITERWYQSSMPASAIERDLHELWQTCYTAAKVADHDSTDQDRLVLYLAQIQNLGPLERFDKRDETSSTIETPHTTDGVAWTDMPYFVGDMKYFWETESRNMSNKELVNVSSFLAKVAALRIARDRMYALGLHILRETFESQRPLGSLTEEPPQAPPPPPFDPFRPQPPPPPPAEGPELSIARLLQAANAWILAAGRNIVQLTEAQEWESDDEHDTDPGPLYYASQRFNPEKRYFSEERWLFWLERIEQIGQQAASEGQEDLQKFAQEVAQNLIDSAANMTYRVTVLWKPEYGGPQVTLPPARPWARPF